MKKDEIQDVNLDFNSVFNVDSNDRDRKDNDVVTIVYAFDALSIVNAGPQDDNQS